MEEGPLPRHERDWRHPSELGPPAHEPTSRTGRVLIVSTGTLGLLLVGILAITMTPRQSESPVAANSTALGLRVRTAPASDRLPIVTPIGDDGWAITTADALDGFNGTTARVRLATGGITVVEIVRVTDEVILVSLPAGSDVDTFDVAATDPSGDDMVVLHDEDDPISVPMGELANADVAEATPVLDDRGRLVGLTTGEPDAHWMVTVDTMPAAPPSTTPPISAAPTTVVITAASTTSTTATTTTSSPPESTVVAETTIPAPTSGPAPTTAGPPATASTTLVPTTVAPSSTVTPPTPPTVTTPTPADPPPSPPSVAPGAGDGAG